MDSNTKIKQLEDVRRVYLKNATAHIHRVGEFYKYEFWNKRIKKIDIEILKLKNQNQTL